jgi:hypothetical protein
LDFNPLFSASLPLELDIMSKATSKPSLCVLRDSAFHRYSVPLDPHTYEGDEYFSRFTPRIHRDAHLADAAAWQCQVDFLSSSDAAHTLTLKDPVKIGYAKGCMNAVTGNCIAVAAPEALPSRLALITYFFEYALTHDDSPVAFLTLRDG